MRAILCYEDTGAKGICGQTIGADGRGEFCIIYHGDEMAIHDEVKKFLQGLQRQHRLGKHILVYDEQRYSGESIREVNL